MLVQKGKYSFDGEEWEIVSKEAKDLIKKLIAKPEKRLSAQEALEHKWIRKMCKNDTKKLKNMDVGAITSIKTGGNTKMQ